MIIDDIAITLEKGLNTHTIAHLIECFGSAENVYQASADDMIRRAELNPKLAEQIQGKRFHEDALEQLKYVNKNRIQTIAFPSEDYPRLLRESYDPPHLLYAVGDTSILNAPMIAMVGTREITNYGSRMCHKLIEELASLCPEAVIVSGLAYGIDAECHRLALKCGLKTIGVVVDLLPNVSPAGNQRLAAEIIASGGCILSEANIFTRKHKGEYIKRNRIMAAMTSGTVIVEAKERGGANSTARLAGDYDRVVMAVPGRADDPCSRGANELIRTLKAKAVLSGLHIAEELGWCDRGHADVERKAKVELTEVQAQIMSVIPLGEVVYTNFIVESCDMEVGDLMAELFELEMQGALRALPGGRFEKV